MIQNNNPETSEILTPEKEEKGVLTPEKEEKKVLTPEDENDYKSPKTGKTLERISTSEDEGKLYFLILKLVKKVIGYSFLTFAGELIFFLKILTIASTMSFTKPNFIVEFPFVEVSNFLTYPPALWDRVFFYFVLLISEQILKVLKNL